MRYPMLWAVLLLVAMAAVQYFLIPKTPCTELTSKPGTMFYTPECAK